MEDKKVYKLFTLTRLYQENVSLYKEFGGCLYLRSISLSVDLVVVAGLAVIYLYRLVPRSPAY